jgi:[ribosomal protein S18]-alanine N-acetyltransferase
MGAEPGTVRSFGSRSRPAMHRDGARLGHTLRNMSSPGTMVDMDLVPFAPSMAPLIASWPRNDTERLAWCSSESVTSSDVVAWASSDDVEAWVLVDNAEIPEVVAYGEIWIDDDELEVELAHLIVSPDRRGRGVGRRFVADLTAIGSNIHRTVVLRVHPDNLVAQRCYLAAGFTRAAAADEAAWNLGQPVAYVWMSRTAEPGHATDRRNLSSG